MRATCSWSSDGATVATGRVVVGHVLDDVEQLGLRLELLERVFGDESHHLGGVVGVQLGELLDEPGGLGGRDQLVQLVGR